MSVGGKGPAWRLYYIDTHHGPYSSEDGPPEHAPPFGVGLIVQDNPDSGREVVMRHDFYYWVPTDGAWWGSDLAGLVDQFAHHPLDRTALKVGRNTSDARWRELVERAIKDPDFAPLSKPPDKAIKKPSAGRGQWSGHGDKLT